MSQRASVRLTTLAAAVLSLGTVVGCQGIAGGTNNTPTPSQTATETAGLTKIVEAFKKFHDDTNAWPVGAMAWSAEKDPSQIDPISFDEHDTALFTMPNTLQKCSDSVSKPCWNGPYLDGKSLGDEVFRDAWGHNRFFSLIRPMDGRGGGVQSAPEGAVLVWSSGADGVDSLGCTDGSCARDWSLLAKGEPSGERADDIVNLVGKTGTPSK